MKTPASQVSDRTVQLGFLLISPDLVALNVESLLNCELPPVVKTVPLLPSPTFPIPGSSEPREAEEQGAIPLPPPQVEVQDAGIEPRQPLYYTPDDEELEQHEISGKLEEMGKSEEIEAAEGYVPPFNNPVYPFGSAIGKVLKMVVGF